MNIAQVISQSQDIEQVLTNIARGVAAFAGVESCTIGITAWTTLPPPPAAAAPLPEGALLARVGSGAAAAFAGALPATIGVAAERRPGAGDVTTGGSPARSSGRQPAS